MPKCQYESVCGKREKQKSDEETMEPILLVHKRGSGDGRCGKCFKGMRNELAEMNKILEDCSNTRR